MDNESLGGLFVCEEYVLEEFTFDGNSTQISLTSRHY